MEQQPGFSFKVRIGYKSRGILQSCPLRKGFSCPSDCLVQYWYSNAQNLFFVQVLSWFYYQCFVTICLFHFLHLPVFAALLTTSPIPPEAPFPWPPSKLCQLAFIIYALVSSHQVKRHLLSVLNLLENQFNQNTTVSLVQF